MFHSKQGTCSFYLQHFACSAGPIFCSIRAKDGFLCMCYSVSRLKRKQYCRMVWIFDIILSRVNSRVQIVGSILSPTLFSVVQGFQSVACAWKDSNWLLCVCGGEIPNGLLAFCQPLGNREAVVDLEKYLPMVWPQFGG